MARAMSETGELPRQQMLIDGEWTESASGEYFESFDPFTAKAWTLIPRGNADDVDRAVQAAHRAFTSGAWPKMHASQRGQLLRKLGDLIARDAEALAAIDIFTRIAPGSSSCGTVTSMICIGSPTPTSAAALQVSGISVIACLSF